MSNDEGKELVLCPRSDAPDLAVTDQHVHDVCARCGGTVLVHRQYYGGDRNDKVIVCLPCAGIDVAKGVDHIGERLSALARMTTNKQVKILVTPEQARLLRELGIPPSRRRHRRR